MSDLKGKTVAGNILAWISMLVLFGVMDGNGIKKYVVAFGICGVFFLVGRKKKWAVEEMLCVIIPTIVYILLGILNNMAIAAVKVANVVSGLVMRKRLIMPHTTANKAAGFVVFLVPFAIPTFGVVAPSIPACVVTTFAAVQESHLIRTGHN